MSVSITSNTDLSSFMFLQVGTEFLRGVSGGERKRTNIGMELIIEPQVLFLDEPTTGLDAYTAVSVVKLLKKYVTFFPGHCAVARMGVEEKAFIMI